MFSGMGTAGAATAPTPVKTVLNSAHRKDKVLVAGKIKRARTLDIFVLSDDTGELLINAANVRTAIAVGNDLVVWGRFWGRSDRQPDLREVEVLEAAQAGSAEAAALIAAHATTAPVEETPSPPLAAPAPTPARSAETRLRELEELKTKGLVNDAEYQEQRKKILGDL